MISLSPKEWSCLLSCIDDSFYQRQWDLLDEKVAQHELAPDMDEEQKRDRIKVRQEWFDAIVALKRKLGMYGQPNESAYAMTKGIAPIPEDIFAEYKADCKAAMDKAWKAQEERLANDPVYQDLVEKEIRFKETRPQFMFLKWKLRDMQDAILADIGMKTSNLSDPSDPAKLQEVARKIEWRRKDFKDRREDVLDHFLAEVRQGMTAELKRISPEKVSSLGVLPCDSATHYCWIVYFTTIGGNKRKENA